MINGNYIQYDGLYWDPIENLIEENKLIDKHYHVWDYDLLCHKCKSKTKKIDNNTFKCVRCGDIELKKTFEQYCEDLDLLMSQYDYENSEIINFDDKYILVNNRKKIENDDLWYDVSMKQNQQGKLMLMILAGNKNKTGNKNKKNKVQLFVIPEEKRLGFDQKDIHPNEVFTYIEAEFKDSVSKILNK